MTAVTVTLGGQRHDGWTRATVRRSLEQVAGSCTVAVSERTPGAMTPRRLRPGAAFTVALDGEAVLTGYVDTVRPSYDAEHHEIELSGRDATADLVDCSAASTPGEWHDQPLEAIAAAIARPFDVAVRATADTGAPLRRHRVEEGETAYEAIERACRMRALLPMSDGRGGLVIGRPARSRAAVRLERGVNLLAARGEATHVDRYSQYTVLGQQPGDDFLRPAEAAHVLASAPDAGVRRHRPLTLIAEQALDAAEAAERARWEADVRAARSRRATVVVQGWRERGETGALWAPGRLVHVTDDWLGLDRLLLITSVEQALDDQGTRTTLVLVDRLAFSARLEPEPESTGWWF